MGAKSTGSHPTTTKADGHLLEYFRNTFVEGGGGTNYVAPTPVGLTASGGVIADYTSGSNVYRAHIFTSSGTFEVTAPGDFDDSLEYLVVAGGGGGGGYSGANGGGGGGAGGLRTNLSGHPKAGAAYPVPAFPTSYTVTIGAGGVHQTSPAPGTDGSNSEFHPTPQSYPSTTFVRSIGGGGGGYNPAAGRPGGSSGGGSAPTSSIVPGNASPDPNHPQPQGNAGGHGGSNVSRGGGGGGGAGSDGGNCSGPFPGGLAGYGGKALQVAIAGPPTSSAAGTPGETGQGWYAGGGGGAGADETFADDKRGIGGRGNDRTGTTPWGGGGNGAPGGSPAVPRDSMNGLSGTGGGGGGGRESSNYGGSGGSGIVVVRYKIGSVNTAKASGGAISFYGGKTIHTFLNSGTFASTPDWSPNTTAEYVLVGGGGAGGSGDDHGAGAGAGGYRTGSTPLSGPFSRTVIVGAGGNGIASQRAAGLGGGYSQFGPLYVGGGGGGNGYGNAGAVPVSPAGGGDGGSSGGSTYGPDGVTPSGSYGNDGGTGANGGNYGSGGGGGAGGAGSNGTTSAGGDGGIGVQLPTTFRDPTSNVGAPGPGGGGYWVAGGGGGSIYNTPSPFGKGGGPGGPYAGGGNGSRDEGDPGLQNTGGGGGGSERDAPFNIGGAGGSGIVLIAYPT